MENKRDYRSILIVVLSALLLIVTGLAIRLYDEYDHYWHKLDEIERNCTWEWDEWGDWTVCR